MAWTASVKGKQIVDSKMHIIVEYTDGEQIITETYYSRNPMAEWIPNTVKNRIKQLENLFQYDIEIGQITPSEEPDPNRQLFWERVRLLEFAKLLIDFGVVEQGNTKVQQLISWLTNNFDKYFE